MEILTPLLALFLGITTSLSFCAFYMLSSIVAFSASSGKYDKFRPPLIALGNFASMILICFLALSIGLIVEKYLIYLQVPAAFFILGVGVYLIFAKVKNVCGDACSCKTSSAINKLKSKGLFESFLFGFSIGLLCIACIFPIFGTIIAMVALADYTVITLLFIFAIGHTLPILAVAYIPYFSEKIAKGKMEKYITIIRKVSGIILIVVATFLFWKLFACGYDCQKHHHNNQQHHHCHNYHYHK